MKPALWLFAAALPLAAQPKLLINAQLDTKSASAGLEQTLRPLVSAQLQPAWIGYSVPSVRVGLGCDTYATASASRASSTSNRPTRP